MGDGYTREVKRKLKEHGCHFERQGKGDHEIWYSPHTNVCFTVDGNIRSRHLANAVMKQAGIKHKF